VLHVHVRFSYFNVLGPAARQRIATIADSAIATRQLHDRGLADENLIAAVDSLRQHKPLL